MQAVRQTHTSYLPWREDWSRADEVRIEEAASTHQSVGAHLTGLGVPPVPVRDGEVEISRHLPDLVLPVEQEDAVPRQKSWRFVGEVDVSPHISSPSQEGIPGHVVVHPHKQVIGVDVREHGVLTIFTHLCSCCCGDHIVTADGVLGQVEIRDEPLLLSVRQGQDVPAHWFSVFGTVWAPVTKPAVPTVKASIVSSAATRPVEES